LTIPSPFLASGGHRFQMWQYEQGIFHNLSRKMQVLSFQASLNPPLVKLACLAIDE
jgi:hypothetical protein